MPSFADRFALWNRRVHYYAGLYLLAFLWLFSLSGLLLNHQWAFAEFWPERRVTLFEREIQSPRGTRDIERAADLMQQLLISGEIGTIITRTPNVFEIQVTRPGTTFQVKADLTGKRASVQRTQVNGWGVFRMLHTFNGVPQAAATVERDWILTRVWTFFMDAISVGVILLVLSSLYMWWDLRTKRRLGIAMLIAGMVSCGFFVVGLRVLC
jgi:hypothetical protein